ncbi:MAG: phytoene/squalene synthase family protein [Gemmatimonadales bacterium]
MTSVDARALRRSYAHAERTTATWARSFHFASRFLLGAKRRAVFALYDYCRHADNLVDLRGSRPADTVRAELVALGRTVRALHAGDPPAERWLALGDTLRRYRVPLDPLLALLDGVAMDLDRVRYTDYPALHRYCLLVAGGVGLMLGPVLGATCSRFRDPAIGLEVAMQLTNVLRDVGEDLDQGRCYLPADELAHFGVDDLALERREVTSDFVALMRFQVTRARRLFRAADSVVDLFPPDGSRLTVRLLQRTYAGILDAIERQGYDVFRHRAYVSGPRKLSILVRSACAIAPWAGWPEVTSDEGG